MCTSLVFTNSVIFGGVISSLVRNLIIFINVHWVVCDREA